MVFGMALNAEIPEKWIPVDAVVVAKCLDERGEPHLLLASTSTLNEWEAVGMLQGAVDTARDDLKDTFVGEWD